MEPDKKTYAQRRREERKTELREKLKGIEYLRILHKALSCANKMNAEKLAVAKFKCDVSLRLLAKCLPDQKAVEVAGAGGGPIEAIVRWQNT